MARYFLEVAYKGTRFSGFQVQENAITIQGEIQKAFATLQRQPVVLTGSSRTDAGVHALQNYFHFDFDSPINDQFLYKINSILPPDISVISLKEVAPSAHSRFDAASREYEYRIYSYKNPFYKGLACYYPFKLDFEALKEAAAIIKENVNFAAFCKSNSQVSNYQCSIIKSQWLKRDDQLIYNIQANRFLRGMVRMITATMLQVGRGKMTFPTFRNFFLPDFSPTTYSISAEGLYLIRVDFPAILTGN